MDQALKPIIFSLKMFGFCSLKTCNIQQRHGYVYYLWVILLAIIVTMVMVSEHSPPILTVYYLMIYLVYILMLINSLRNDKKLIDILKENERFDLEIGFKGENNYVISTLICVFWAMFNIWKIGMRWKQGYDVTILAVMAMKYPDYITLSLASTFYEQFTLRYSALAHQLSLCVENLPNGRNSLRKLENIRLLYFNLGRQVLSVNEYLGFRLFSSVFMRNVVSFMKFYVFFTMHEKLLFGTVLILLPDELVQIFFLTVKADTLIQESKKISMILKNTPVMNTAPNVKMQVELFILQIEGRPLEVTANGIFVVERKLFFSMMFTAATYFVTFYLMKNEVYTLTNTITSFINSTIGLRRYNIGSHFFD